jgi:lipopolysaccharide transport system permease protein
MKDMLINVWRYRHFILSSIKAEFRTRFIRSKFGGLWMIIHPLAQAAIYALVLSEIMSAKLPGMANDKQAYAIYLLSGILAWSLFSEVIGRCLTLFMDNANLLKKIVFPRISLPLIVTGTALFNNLLLFLAIVLIFGLLDHLPGIQILWVPLLMLITLTLSLGVGLILGILNVFIRDVGQVVPIVLQLGFWFTPIVYMPDILPEKFRSFLYINPMATLVQGFQNAMLFNTPPDWIHLVYLTFVIGVLLSVALIMFRRSNAEMVDVL